MYIINHNICIYIYFIVLFFCCCCSYLCTISLFSLFYIQSNISIDSTFRNQKILFGKIFGFIHLYTYGLKAVDNFKIRTYQSKIGTLQGKKGLSSVQHKRKHKYKEKEELSNILIIWKVFTVWFGIKRTRCSRNCDNLAVMCL